MKATARQYSLLAPAMFLLPAALMFIVYVLYPISQSVLLSFYEWDGVSADRVFIGLDNYRELMDDPRFWTSIKNNVLWLLFYMLAPAAGLAIALFLNQTVLGIRLIKSLFFFPFVISQVVVGLVFTWFYDPTFGLLNDVLNFFGIASVNLLGNENLATYGIIAAGLWPQIAYCMILYLTGLNNLDSDQLEAARMDGAKGLRMLWYIVLPQLRPATFIAVVVSVIGALRSFDLVATMTGGGPWGSTNVLAHFMYQQSIFNYRAGYGAAIAVVLFAIMMIYIAFFLWRMLRTEK